MKNRNLQYLLGFLMFYISFVISISCKKGYTDNLGIPLILYYVFFIVLVVIAIYLKYKK